MDLGSLIFYRDIAQNPAISSADPYLYIGDIVKTAEENGFFGNLWQCYVAYLIICSENPYSLACEMRGDTGGSISEIASADFHLLMKVFNSKAVETFTGFKNYHPQNPNTDSLVVNFAKELAAVTNPTDFKNAVAEFYHNKGVGRYALHPAFYLGEAGIAPVNRPDPIRFCDLVGYETPKRKLIDNTEAFINGRRANNCLLFGSAGTGKSSSVKAVLNEYRDAGLRLIELYKHQLKELGKVISEIRNRNYKFIIYMDDLSFEEFEVEYKYLKAIIEGSIERKPDNVLIYATSNRRHLIREEFSDRESLHGSETVQEKISLSARFGEMIFFDSPDKKQYNNIVKALAEREGLEIEEEELLLAANRWEMSHSGKSGRSARQFIDHLLGNSE